MGYGYNEERRSSSLSIGAIIVLCLFASAIIATVAIGGTAYSSYKKLVNAEEDVNLAMSNVENAMQRRVELIPDLWKVVQASSEHVERVNSATSTLKDLLESQDPDSMDPEAIDAANIKLTTEINECLSFVVRNYPEVTASEQYTALMDQLEGSVNRISYAREQYNVEVNEYNRLLRLPPTSILAEEYGFEKKEEFKASEEAYETSLIDFE